LGRRSRRRFAQRARESDQLVIAEHTRAGLAQLRAALIAEHKQAAGSDAGCWLVSAHAFGRYCKPNSHHRAEPRILYRHPILDRRLGYRLISRCSPMERLAESSKSSSRGAHRVGARF